MLMFGILYLGQYQNKIIETKLRNFGREVQTLSILISEIDTEEPDNLTKIIRLLDKQEQEIRIYSPEGKIDPNKTFAIRDRSDKKTTQAIQILKDTASFITGFLPETKKFPQYPGSDPHTAQFTPDLSEALKGNLSLSVWEDKEGKFILSGGAPILVDGQVRGAVILLKKGDEINESIGLLWQDILKIFAFTLLITIFISIYLAGAIANPLKKLARAAEDVRSGRIRGDEIPDLSHRLDEIGDLSVVLRGMTDALSTKMNSIESFAADVAHELKNPLTSLKSAIETLEKIKKDSDRKKLLDIITHDIHRMDRLITDISAASRLDAELSREQFKTLELSKVIEELLEGYKNPIEREKSPDSTNITTEDGISITFDHDSSQEYAINGSSDRLKQVFQNLIDNAISFSEKGKHINITLTKSNSFVIVQIDDEGPGIPDKKRQTIFERFYTERPDHAYGQNSGLGLSICKQIIDSHRGSIFAENIRDNANKIVGARFSVVIKAA